MDYKEQIEKEAKRFAYPMETNNPLIENFQDGVYKGFISGVNSKISERIKVEFAMECLNEIISDACDEDVFYRLENKITELKKQIDGK